MSRTRGLFLDLARSGLRMPIGTDLILHEQPEPERVVCDRGALGRVLKLAAERYRTPLALPLMDLRLEKAHRLAMLGSAASSPTHFTFVEPPDPGAARIAQDTAC